jgi:hypothetical protein
MLKPNQHYVLCLLELVISERITFSSCIENGKSQQHILPNRLQKSSNVKLIPGISISYKIALVVGSM